MNGVLLQPQHLQSLVDLDFAVIDGFLDQNLSKNLLSDFENSKKHFRPAGVGAGAQRHESVRSDLIEWWDDQNMSSARLSYWNIMLGLQKQLNQEFFLGLKSFEAHYALYASGGFYKEHLDAQQGKRSRVISTIYYLNPSWSDFDGGELELTEKSQLITPVFNRFVIFKSESVLHQVRVSKRDRMSLTGWFHA